MRRIRTLLAVGLLLTTALVINPVAAQDDTSSVTDAISIAQLHMAEQFPTGGEIGVTTTDAYTSAHNGVAHVYLRQTFDGIEVFGAEASVNVKGDAVLFERNRFVENLRGAAAGEQVVQVDEAVAIAAADTDTAVADLIDTPVLAYRALEDGRVRLVHDLQLVSDAHWWNVSVDAQTGEVVYVADWVDSENAAEIASRFTRAEDAPLVEALLDAQGSDLAQAAEAPVAEENEGSDPNAPILTPDPVDDGSSYNVFALPLESPLDGDRSIVANPADAIASPFGWHDTDGVAGPEFTITRGNNVDAYADTVGGTVPGIRQGDVGTDPIPVQGNEPDPASQPEGGEELTFDYPLLTTDATPAVYRDAAVTNLFYWNNIMHDVTFRYGFDEAAGNFQQTNYSGAGVGDDAVDAEAQDGGGALNANFATPPDGAPGRMQMYLWVDGFRALGGDVARAPSHQVRDGDLDSGVIAHEYGHGISNRLVGGPSNVSCLRSHDERQGEGWSDWWSFALTMREGDDGATPRGIGNYVIYHDEGRAAPGIRITPYSTDMDVNPSTYNTVRTAAEPHGVGYVWASMLWDMYWNLVDVHGFNANPYDAWDTGGNNLAIQLAIDGMKFAPCEPGFADARDAIISADAALTGEPGTDGEHATEGENFCLIWETFARRGLGLSADQGDPASKTDGVEEFDVPEGCTPPDFE